MVRHEKISGLGQVLVKWPVPRSIKIDGIDQYQPCHGTQVCRAEKVFDFVVCFLFNPGVDLFPGFSLSVLSV